jgi:Transglutaminase-like superfamily
MRLLGHRAGDYATMAESVALALWIEVELRRTSVAALLERLDRIEPSRWSTLIASYQLDQFAGAAYRLLPIKSTCLRESLVLYALLRRRGATPRLCVGVRKDAGQLVAHAWIECAGLTMRNEKAFFQELTGEAPSTS